MLKWGMKDEKEHHPTREVIVTSRRSFVLRVWLDDTSGEMRGYLSDVRTNIRHPFKKTSELPPLIRSMFDIREPKQDD